MYVSRYPLNQLCDRLANYEIMIPNIDISSSTRDRLANHKTMVQILTTHFLHVLLCSTRTYFINQIKKKKKKKKMKTGAFFRSMPSSISHR